MPFTGSGTIMYLANSSPIVAVAQVEGANPGGLTRPTVPVPATNEEYTRHIDGGKVNAEPIEVRLSWDPSQASYTTLRALLDSGASTAFRFVLPTSPVETISFSGFVTALSQEYSDGERATATLTIQPTSATGAANPYTFT